MDKKYEIFNLDKSAVNKNNNSNEKSQKTSTRHIIVAGGLLIISSMVFLYCFLNLVDETPTVFSAQWLPFVFATSLVFIISSVIRLFFLLWKHNIFKLFVIVCSLLGIGAFILAMYGTFNPASNSDLTGSESTVSCNRTEPYKLAPEFERARSLRLQRIKESGIEMDLAFYNCINIEYADLTEMGAFGLFYFDSNSSLDKLTIYVDNSYKANDDILTAILLSHEYVHLGQFLNSIKTGVKISCVDSEVDAHLAELAFFSVLNTEEVNSLSARAYLYKNKEVKKAAGIDEIESLEYLYSLLVEAANSCGKLTGNEYENCAIEGLRENLKEYILSQPAYIEQCKDDPQ